MINIYTLSLDRIAAAVSGTRRVHALEECQLCRTPMGQRHRLAGCKGNHRDTLVYELAADVDSCLSIEQALAIVKQIIPLEELTDGAV